MYIYIYIHIYTYIYIYIYVYENLGTQGKCVTCGLTEWWSL